MTRVLRINEFFDDKPPLFDDMPSGSDRQRPRYAGIKKCASIFETPEARKILEKFGVEMHKTDENIALYFSIKANKSDLKKMEDAEYTMQECIHELDLCTDLYFETGWSGTGTGKMDDKIVYKYVRNHPF